MSLTLRVAADDWHAGLHSLVDIAPVAIVPVVKGNGYGFGRSTLAGVAAKLRTETLAVGTYEELDVAGQFPGDLLTLTPWRPWVTADLADDRIIHTVSRLDDLQAIAGSGTKPRIVIELVTSMRRHGMVPSDLKTATGLLGGVRCEGWTLHLPLEGDPLGEARELCRLAQATADAAGTEQTPVWLSHVSPDEAGRLAADLAVDVKLRIGTNLWLGDRRLLRARATVLDVHRVRRGDRFGYRQRRAARDGAIVIVTGGTSHGIALEAPTPATSMRQRAVAVAKGGLDAVGRAMSPFYIAGKQRWFAEPPHMQCSMIWLPSGAPAPAVGDELPVDVRFTTTTFDAVDFAPR